VRSFKEVTLLEPCIADEKEGEGEEAVRRVPVLAWVWLAKVGYARHAFVSERVHITAGDMSRCVEGVAKRMNRVGRLPRRGG
jgi:hypothetical protein